MNLRKRQTDGLSGISPPDNSASRACWARKSEETVWRQLWNESNQSSHKFRGRSGGDYDFLPSYSLMSVDFLDCEPTSTFTMESLNLLSIYVETLMCLEVMEMPVILWEKSDSPLFFQTLTFSSPKKLWYHAEPLLLGITPLFSAQNNTDLCFDQSCLLERRSSQTFKDEIGDSTEWIQGCWHPMMCYTSIIFSK